MKGSEYMALLSGAIKLAKTVSKAMQSSKPNTSQSSSSSNSGGGGSNKSVSVPTSSITNPSHYSKTGDSFGTAVKQDLKNQGLSDVRSDGGGFGYTDKYGFTHVVNNYETAMTNSKDGRIYDPPSNFSGGYARNELGGREYLAGFAGSTNFGNYNDVIDDKNLTPDSINNNKYNLADIQRLLREKQDVDNRVTQNNQLNTMGAVKQSASPLTVSPVQNNAQAPKGQFAYQNFDINGNLIGTTYGESGRSNALPGASYVKAPNGQTYQTANFGSQGMTAQQNNFVANTGMQAQAGTADLNGGFYMNPKDYMVEDNSKAIEAQYEAMARAMEAQRRNALDQTLSDINFARDGLSAQYDPAKNDIYAQGRINQQGIEEYMGSLGMEGGQNITAQARNNNATQQAIGQIEAQKQAQDAVLQKSAIDAQRANSLQELEQMYQVNAQKIQAILQDSQYTNQANLQAMKDAFQFNYQARADELARQDANRNFFYGASQDSRNNWNQQQQFEYEKMMNDRDFNFKQEQAKLDQSNWERQFNLSQQKKSSGGSGGSRSSSSGSSSGGQYVDTNTLKASIYSNIDEKLNMVPMGSGGKPQYPGQFNTKAAQKWLDDNRNTIIQELGETAYKTYQTYINKKTSVGS